MKRWKSLAAIMASVAVLGGVAAGCSDSDSSEASTPAAATTAPNTAVQTDKDGSTVAETTAPAETEATTEASTEGGGGEEASGDATAGKATFEAICQGCHANGGQDAGVGPKLAGGGRTLDLIKTTVQNGKGVMPAGLVSGDDLENVAAYVLSIQ